MTTYSQYIKNPTAFCRNASKNKVLRLLTEVKDSKTILLICWGLVNADRAFQTTRYPNEKHTYPKNYFCFVKTDVLSFFYWL